MPAQTPEYPAHEPVEDEWGAPAVPADRPADTSGFFAARQQAEGNGVSDPAFEPKERQFHSEAQPLHPESQATSGSDDAIYQRMLSEWLVDPSDWANSADLNWESVWDSGWSAAEAAEETPVQQHTEEGLPVREPGARLVPGTAESAGSEAGDHRNADANRNADDDEEVASAAEFGSPESDASSAGGAPQPPRDPDAVRASISSHFGGVHAGRSHARETRGTENQ